MIDAGHHQRAFVSALLPWFREHKRCFYWRRSYLPHYELIISELFLQRTRASTVHGFVPDFIQRFPTWQSIAETRESALADVLKPIGLWRRRAHSLHRLAAVLSGLEGQFPEERSAIESLPGIGQYMANAIELLCHGRARPLLDVNMARVLERYFGSRTRADIRYDPFLQRLAGEIVKIGDPIPLNWAILDLAALVCRNLRPKCHTCPLFQGCKYFRQHRS